jgi:transposase InsO family protein
VKHKSKRYAPGFRARAVRMVLEHAGEHPSQWAAIQSTAAKVGCTDETLRGWVRQAERDSSRRGGLTGSERDRLKALERENRELKRANEILGKASASFPQAELGREDQDVARCTVKRLKRRLGLHGVVRGKKRRTTIPDDRAERPLDRVNRQFQARRPNQLSVAGFTYVATWAGVVCVVFVIDVFARRIIGWRVSRSMSTDLVVDALQQALRARSGTQGVNHHSDRGGQYLSIRYTDRLAEASAEPPVGSVVDTYDNVLAETIIGL